MSGRVPVTIVRTGAANLASVIAAVRRAGDYFPMVTDEPADVRAAPIVVLPGVGSFGPAMRRLKSCGLIDPLRERVAESRATLAICLGLQLLACESDESPGVPGLGVVEARVTRFAGAVRVPQMGWNRVEPADGFDLSPPGDAYFANSYRLTDCPPGWCAAWSTYAGPFIAALQRGSVLACQFHPELSGAWGRDVLTSWLSLAAKKLSRC